MPLLSLRTRLVALFVVSLAIAAFLFAAVAVRQFTQDERSRARSDLRRQAHETVLLIGEFAEKRLRNEAGAPPDFASKLGGITNASVYFVGRSGLQPPIDEVRFGRAPAGTEARLDWKLLATGRTQTLDLTLADGTSTIAAAGGFRYGGELIGAIVMARPVRSISTGTLVQGRRVVPPLLLAVAAAAMVALLLSRRITRPVQELTEASERVARGDYDVTLTSKGPDELGQLALRFEQMARRLKEASEHERNFLMRISHELRTPLTAIQGHVQAIADGVIDGEEERQASLEIVLAEAGRLQRLIGDLLDLARLETRRFSLNVEEVDARRGLRPGRRRPARGGARRAAWRCTCTSRPSRSCSATATASSRSSRTSSRNALHATPADGDVTVDVALVDGVGRVVVSDTGPGIPEEERASILRPFVTSDIRDGIGLGLPVASELAQAMGGTLVVGERPGGGAAFTLTLPVARASGRGLRRNRNRPPSSSPSSRRAAHRGAQSPEGAPVRWHGAHFVLPTWVTASCSLCTSAVAMGPPTLLSIAAATATSRAATARTMPTYSTVPCPRSSCSMRAATTCALDRDMGRAPRVGLRAAQGACTRCGCAARGSCAESLGDDRETTCAGTQDDEMPVVARGLVGAEAASEVDERGRVLAAVPPVRAVHGPVDDDVARSQSRGYSAVVRAGEIDELRRRPQAVERLGQASGRDGERSSERRPDPPERDHAERVERDRARTCVVFECGGEREALRRDGDPRHGRRPRRGLDVAVAVSVRIEHVWPVLQASPRPIGARRAQPGSSIPSRGQHQCVGDLAGVLRPAAPGERHQGGVGRDGRLVRAHRRLDVGDVRGRGDRDGTALVAPQCRCEGVP